MGLDLALGGLVLVAAIRGWLKGFLVQAIRLGGLVASVYLAAPVRDQIKPYVAGQLPSMQPELLDRMLWWASGVGAYLVLVGVASVIVAVSRRQTFGIAEPNRSDQFAGFGLGVVKGLVVASFVVAGLQKYAEPQMAKVSWAEEQKKESWAWMWNRKYHPAARIWAAPPVQSFVNQIQSMGLKGLPGTGTAEPRVEKTVQTASRGPTLTLASGSNPATPAQRARATRHPLTLKRPFSRQSAPAASAGSRPPIDTTGLDPELSGAVQDILSKLQDQGLGAP